MVAYLIPFHFVEVILTLDKKEYDVFEYEDMVKVCLVVENGGRRECAVDTDIHYSVHTFGGSAGEGFLLHT